MFHQFASNTVTATASTQEKLDWLLSIPSGATHAVNYKTQDFAAEVKKTTGGKGVDVIIDFVGRSHWQKNIDALAVDGRMTMLGLLSGINFTAALSVRQACLSYCIDRWRGREIQFGTSVVQTAPNPRFNTSCAFSGLPSGLGEEVLYAHICIFGVAADSFVDTLPVLLRFRDEVLSHISGSAGNGEVRTYIHKVRAIGFFVNI